MTYALAPSLDCLDWQSSALCAQSDPELWHPDRRSDPATEAKRVCEDCPVRWKCLDTAMAAEAGLHSASRYGIWGGLTPRERAALDDTEPTGEETADTKPSARVRAKGGRKIAPCGTSSAYSRHVRNREPIDEACRRAHTEADRRLRATGSSKARA
jgi:hypothetical protein